MPTVRDIDSPPPEHRPRIRLHEAIHNAAIARSVGAKEIRQEKDAREALQKEWDRLQFIKTWDEDSVQEREWMMK